MQSRQANPQQYVDPIIAKQHIKRVFLKSYLARALPILLVHACVFYCAYLLYLLKVTNDGAISIIGFLYLFTVFFSVILTTRKFSLSLNVRKRGRTAYVKRTSYAGRKNDNKKYDKPVIVQSALIWYVIFLFPTVFVVAVLSIFPSSLVFIYVPLVTAAMCAMSCFFYFRFIQVGPDHKNQRHSFEYNTSNAISNDPLDPKNPSGTICPWSPNSPLSMVNHDFNHQIAEQNRVFDSSSNHYY